MFLACESAMKNLFCAVILLTFTSAAMQETPMRLPLEIWAKIFSHVIDLNENKEKNVDEIKKIKLISKSFYKVCDSDAVHAMISYDPIISTLKLNTKEKRNKLYADFFQPDQKKLLFIFESAVRYSVIPVIEKVIDKGINPNQYCTLGYNCKVTALCHAALTNNRELTIRLLNNPKTDPNMQTELFEGYETIPNSAQHTQTPLILAAQKNHVDVLTELLKHPLIDMQIMTSEGKTALDIALNNHQQMAANILLLEQERRKPHTWCESTCHMVSLCNPQACIIS